MRLSCISVRRSFGRAVSLALLTVFSAHALAEPFHAGLGAPKSDPAVRASAEGALPKQLVSFVEENFSSWNKDLFFDYFGSFLPDALQKKLRLPDPETVGEKELAYTTVRLFGPSSETDLVAATTKAAAEYERISKLTSPTGAETDVKLFLERFLWGIQIEFGTDPRFKAAEIAKKVDPRFKAFEGFFKPFLEKVRTEGEEYHKQIAAIAAEKDDLEKAKKREAISKNFASLPTFVAANLASTDPTGKDVADKFLKAFDLNGNLDLFDHQGDAVRVPLGSDPAQTAAKAREAFDKFPPLAPKVRSQARFASAPHKTPKETFGVAATPPPGKGTPPAGALAEVKFSKKPDLSVEKEFLTMAMDRCGSCHSEKDGASGNMLFFRNDGSLNEPAIKNLRAKLIDAFTNGHATNKRLNGTPFGKQMTGVMEDLKADLQNKEPAKAAETAKLKKTIDDWAKGHVVEGKTASAVGKEPDDLEDAEKRGFFAKKNLVKPDDLAKRLADPTSAKPVLVNVGNFGRENGVIKGSTDAGPTSKVQGELRLLSALANRVPGQKVLIYCGCCGTDGCPFVNSGLAALKKAGVAIDDIEVLDIDHTENLVKVWHDKGREFEPGTDSPKKKKV